MSEVLQKFQVFNGDIGQMILKPRYPKGSGASHNKKAPESIRCFLAGAEGLEPSTKVLETHVLPLHHGSIETGDSDTADFTIGGTLEKFP